MKKTKPDHLIEHFAHKIRNPLHSMGINLEVIKTELNRSKGKNLPKLKKHIDIVTLELDTMKRMIQEFTETDSHLDKK